MPIYDLSDRRRFQILGKIRLGVKKVSEKTGKEYPTATDYFVVPEEVAGLHGNKPTTLPIWFYFDSLEMTFPQYHKRYMQRGLRCMGDGRMVIVRYTGPVDTPVAVVKNGVGKPEEQPEEYGPAERFGTNGIRCSGLECPFQTMKNPECRPTGRLLFSVDGLSRLGLYQLTVHQRAIVGINSQLMLAQAMFGHITDIPFLLHLTPEEVQVNGTRRKIYTPWIEIEPNWLAREFRRRQEHKQLVQAAKERQTKEDIALLYGPQPEDLEPLDDDETTISIEDVETYDEVIQEDRTQSEPPAWLIELREGLDTAPGASDPENAGNIKGLMTALARKFGDDNLARAFVVTLLGYQPEEMTKAASRYLSNLSCDNGKLFELARKLGLLPEPIL